MHNKCLIDICYEVYTRIAEMLRVKFPGIHTASEYVKSPPTFPHASIEQKDNYPIKEHEDSSNQENMVQVTFTVNVFSNKSSGKKTECKQIMNAINDLLTSMNFRRLAMTPVPNMEDATIYRITACYRVATDGKYFYRR